MRRLRKARGKGFVCVENVKRMGALHPSPLRERELVSSHETWKAKESIQSVQVPKGSYRNNTRNVVCFFDLNYYFAAM